MSAWFLVSLLDKRGNKIPVELEVTAREIVFSRDSEVCQVTENESRKCWNLCILVE